ncbi:MAG TPA: SDR family NAD(P)-dependent oxidoreductase, partial [Bdellovibrionales bacterium]|nr:SDR family NAD(P)-dependent oxidoreductase [Bdellovibrionales bacterium]
MAKILITGPTSGIGRHVALQLAESARLGEARNERHEFYLVARSTEGLQKIAGEMRDITKQAAIHTFALDLSEKGAAEQIAKKIKDVDVLILNAGVGLSGRFLDQPLEKIEKMWTLNCESTVELCWHFGRKMREAKSGKIVLVSSFAGFLPVPYLSVYSASKAFVSALGEALHEELREHGIDVTTVCPVGVKTQFHIKAGLSDGLVQKYDMTMSTPEAVAAAVVAATRNGGYVVIPGFSNRLFKKTMGLFPRRFLIGQIA